MNAQDFRTLFQYNAWANHRTLEACSALSTEQFTRDLDASFRSVRDTLVHIMGVEALWLERWQHGGIGLPAKGSDYPDLEAVKAKWAKIEADLVGYVNGLSNEDVLRVITHKNFAGQEFQMPLWQLMQHLLNHSTYHRGQVTTLVRQVGGKPLGTDLVGFYRAHPELANATA